MRAMRGRAGRAVLSPPVREEGRGDRHGRREEAHPALHPAAPARLQRRAAAPPARAGAQAAAEGPRRAAAGRAAREGAAGRSLRGAGGGEAGDGGGIERVACLRTNKQNINRGRCARAWRRAASPPPRRSSQRSSRPGTESIRVYRSFLALIPH